MDKSYRNLFCIQNSVVFALSYSTFLLQLSNCGFVAAQSFPAPTVKNTTGNSNSEIFALPEIQIKLWNGTVFKTEPNTPVELTQEIKFVELVCTADYPVKWEYLVMNKSIPIVDVRYRRLVRNSSDFSNPKRNRFMALITLRGLLESQSGKYLCRHFNEKQGNNSYTISSYFNIFVPGNRTFNAISSIKFMNKTAPHVNIYCPTTNPKLHVRLYKLNEKHFNKTGEVVWKPIYANYEPTDGFKLLSGLGRELLGTYNCTADNGVSLLSVIADASERRLYLSSSLSIPFNESCLENPKFIQSVRSKRLECYCKDSFGLFSNENGDFENRQASCPNSTAFREEITRKCKDWRIAEFFTNEEEAENELSLSRPRDTVCFRWNETDTQMGMDGIELSGSRPSLKVEAKTFENGDNQRNYSFTQLTVIYNGFVDWAGDFKLAICRKDFCMQNRKSNNEMFMQTSNELMDDSSINLSNNRTDSFLEYLENEPTHTHYFPLAHYQAVWEDLIVNGTDIKLVYVFQAHSLSYAWFPYATGEIKWRANDDQEKQSGNNHVMMPSYSSASSPTFITDKNIIVYYLMGSLLLLFVSKYS